MADTKKKVPSFVTPAGTFKFPRLNEPDTKFNAKGTYSVKLILSAEDAATLEGKLKEIHDAAAADGRDKMKAMTPAQKAKLKEAGKSKLNVKPISSAVFDEAEKETGEREFNFKLDAEVTAKATGKTWTQKPALFDAKGAPTNVSVWGGTIGKVSFEAFPYFVPATVDAGLSLRLKAVQIIELVTSGQKSAKGYGFGEEEGFEADPAESFPTDDKAAPAEAAGASSGTETDF